MSDPADDAALFRFWADMLDTYGERWPYRLGGVLVADPAAPSIDPPPRLQDPAELSILILLPYPVFELLRARAGDLGLDVAQFLLTKVGVTDDLL
ncbi:hypothetical protein D7D52_22115 [Nocardia yunnanensis]|uniref:Uncharacterized protein n=1 Tax=Nocardia yunnanensis TaxID=2382165 RepID=A0A386ZF92_9NOCA|nr:hypothetical protein [Nocardia yunnanensis]AYF76087.1 hypothetical protein D7D52_22115 [Nocardia yunnanensis]